MRGPLSVYGPEDFRGRTGVLRVEVEGLRAEVKGLIN